MKINRFRAGIIYASVFIVAVILSFTKLASANSTFGDLFYTTSTLFDGSILEPPVPTVHKVHYDFNGTTFTLTGFTDIADLSGADGILFGTNGNLIVANQFGGGAPKFTEYTTGGTQVAQVGSGIGSFHLALSSAALDATLYNAGSGGCGNFCISATTLSAGGLLGAANASLYTVSCDASTPSCSKAVYSLILDTHNGKWYYGAAPDGSTGDFGTVVFSDTTKTATLTQLRTGLPAHGIVFDPCDSCPLLSRNKLIVVGLGTILQLNEDGTTFSSFTLGPSIFDQASVDGQGHLFVASNSGRLRFIDYAASGLIGDLSNFSEAPSAAFLVALDDIAPLSGLGSPLTQGVPEPSTLILFGIGTIVLARSSRRRES